MQVIEQAAEKIKLFVTDVDGIMTDGTLVYDHKGHELKMFNVLDGLGLKLLQQQGIEVAIISSRNSAAVSQRAKDLEIKHVFQGKEDKRATLSELILHLHLQPEQVAYIGDDLQDLALIKYVGLGITVPNAHPVVREQARWQTIAKGGQGAVRECCDLILKAQKHYPLIIEQYKQWVD